MTTPLPKRRKSVRRGEILAAATEVFREKPFEQASIGEIAARADCVEGTLYTYFRNKRDLFDAVLAAFYDRLVADIEPRFASIDGTEDRLRFLVSRHLQIAVEDPAFAVLIPREVKGPRPYYGSVLHDLNRRYSRFMLRTLQDGVDRGDLRAGLDVHLARDMVFGGLEHWVGNALGRSRRIDASRGAREIVAMLLSGWGPRPESGTAATVPLQALEQRLSRLEDRMRRKSPKTRENVA